MYCSQCGEKIKEDAQFCVECGNEVEIENNRGVGIFEDSDQNVDTQVLKDNSINQNIFKKIFKGIGVGGVIIGGGLLSLILSVLRFLYIAFAGLSTIWLAVVLFQKGSIFFGLIVLIIGTPISIGIASYFFLPVLFLSILTLIIWGIISVFGISISIDTVWAWVWFIIKVLVVGSMAYLGISDFVESIRKKQVGNFFRDNWFYIPLFFFLLWLFFSI